MPARTPLCGLMRGEVDLGNAAAVESELCAALAHRARVVAVDLAWRKPVKA